MRRSVASLALCCAVLVGCGGKDDKPPQARTIEQDLSGYQQSQSRIAIGGGGKTSRAADRSETRLLAPGDRPGRGRARFDLEDGVLTVTVRVTDLGRAGSAPIGAWLEGAKLSDRFLGRLRLARSAKRGRLTGRMRTKEASDLTTGDGRLVLRELTGDEPTRRGATLLAGDVGIVWFVSRSEDERNAFLTRP